MAAVNWKNEQVKWTELPEETPLLQLQRPQEEKGASCAEELIRVKILQDDDRYFQVGASIREKDRVEMLLFLIQNVDVFAWSSYEVPEVDPEFIIHKLNVDPSFSPKKQKPRRLAKEHVEVVRQKVKRLKKAGAIREFFFPEWLANTVVVKKKNGK